jgi:hypothetical protein
VSDVIQAPALINVSAPVPQIVTQTPPEQVAVRILETSQVETERIEHVVIHEERAGVQIIAVGAQGPAGTGGGGSTIETYVAGQDIGGHRVIVTDADGEAIYADNTIAAHANAATKITLGAALTGDDLTAQLIGRITEPSWNWVVGGTIYVGTNGLMTQTPPVSPAVFSKPIAVAETATRVLIIQEPPIML